MSILDAAGMSWICSRQGCDAAAMTASFRVANLSIRRLSYPPRNFSCRIRMESRSLACSATFGWNLVRKMLRMFMSNDDDSEFLPWLREKSGQEISSALTLGRSAYGRSLFSSRSIRAGERILSVPRNVQLTPDDIPSLLKPLISDEVGDKGRLSIVLLASKRSREGSDWAPYIRRLPCIDEMHTLILWSDNELEMLRPSLIYHGALHQKNCIEKEFSVLKPVLESFSEIFGHVSLKSFMHAYALVGSHAWETSKGVFLIPFADFLNHDGNSEEAFMSDEELTFEIVATRDYAAGEEILIRYGKLSNATLLLNFGFTVRENMYDEVNILMDVPRYDPLYQTKLELLKRHGIQTTGKFTDIDSSEGYFTIKEVRSIDERGKGIPGTLRAFARILTAKSLDDLQEMCIEAYENDGRLARRPLGIKDREIEAHRILLSKISPMIENYSNSLQRIDFLSKSRTRDRLPCRISMARDLLAGELRVLKSARSWLENYCST